ncbi:MAG: peptidase M50 [Roseovarius sp.]
MAGSYFSEHWFRVKDLRPRLRRHVTVHRHVVRGDVWHVLQDDQTGSHFRVTPAAYHFISGLDGRRTVAEVWESVGRHVGRDHLGQDEVILFLAQLHRSDMLGGEILPDLTELTERARSQARRTIMSRVRNPLALRFPLIDPDAFLTRWMPMMRWLFTPFGFIVWACLVAYGAVLMISQWDVLTHNVFDRVISMSTLVFFLVLYPLMKGLHELGHGFAVKAWGGQVHEMGIMFLVFMPVPYVDASAASAFRQRRRRAVVGGIGIMVELALASAAMIVWSMAEPGLLRAAAFNVMLIGGVSTVLFNGNPLLRFDGYYVLCDAIDMPNLGTRSNKYLQYLVLRYGFGKTDAESPVTAQGERKWLVGYGVLSFFYRIVIMIGISLWVASKFFFIGVVLALLSVFLTIVMPLWKGFRFVFQSRRLAERQGRAKAVTLGVLAILGAFLFLVPAPHATVSHGVVWVPAEGRVVASNGGFVSVLHVAPGERVEAGEPLATLSDLKVASQIRLLEAQEKEFRARFDLLNLRDPGQSRIVAEQLARTRASLEFWRERDRLLTILARQAGAFVLPGNRDALVGRLVPEGMLIGYVLSEAPRRLRVVVPQERITDVSDDTRSVDLRFASALAVQVPGRVGHVTPAAIERLTSSVLGPAGGGPVLLDPQAETGAARPLNNHFEVEVEVLEDGAHWRPEERAIVRFRHTPAPLGVQFLRSVREVFLRQFDV